VESVDVKYINKRGINKLPHDPRDLRLRGLMVSVLGCKAPRETAVCTGIWHHSVAHKLCARENALRHLWRCRACVATNENESTPCMRENAYLFLRALRRDEKKCDTIAISVRDSFFSNLDGKLVHGIRIRVGISEC
jgi:hypothetical protein